MLGLRHGDALDNARQLVVELGDFLEHCGVLWIVENGLESCAKRIRHRYLDVVDRGLRVLVELLIDANSVRYTNGRKRTKVLSYVLAQQGDVTDLSSSDHLSKLASQK